MKQYIGTKLIEAEPAYRCTDGSGKVVITTRPEEAFPNYPSVEEGYRVRYPDGYASWSPKETFEKAYLPLNINEELGTSAPSIGAKMVDDMSVKQRRVFIEADDAAVRRQVGGDVGGRSAGRAGDDGNGCLGGVVAVFHAGRLGLFAV